MEHVQTTIFEDAVYVRLADSADADEASEWIDIQVLLEGLMNPRNPTTLLGDPKLQYLSEVQLAALVHARNVLSEQIQRLSGR